MVKLSDQLATDCIDLENRVRNWSRDLKAKLRHVHRIVGVMWRDEAKKRVPVDNSTLKERIFDNVYLDGGYIFVTEVGTNIPEYPIYLEFGTQFIAGGAVLALGDSTALTDKDAVHMWPAKEKGLKDMAPGTNSNEQMPWLRPAFNARRDEIIERLNQVIVISPTQSP